jgi:hypothetical protein
VSAAAKKFAANPEADDLSLSLLDEAPAEADVLPLVLLDEALAEAADIPFHPAKVAVLPLDLLDEALVAGVLPLGLIDEALAGANVLHLVFFDKAPDEATVLLLVLLD